MCSESSVRVEAMAMLSSPCMYILYVGEETDSICSLTFSVFKSTVHTCVSLFYLDIYVCTCLCKGKGKLTRSKDIEISDNNSSLII